MLSGTTGYSASPIQASASPGSYLTVDGLGPGGPNPTAEPLAHAGQHENRADPPPSALQPYYQLPDSRGSPEEAGPTDRLWGLSGAGHAMSSSSSAAAAQGLPEQHTAALPASTRPAMAAPAPLFVPSSTGAYGGGASPKGHTRLVSPAIHVMHNAAPMASGHAEAAMTTPTRSTGAAPLSTRPLASQIVARVASPPSPSTTTIDYADIEQKQAELRGAVEYRIAHLESSLTAREEEVAALRGQLRRMEEDYQFNYNLIGERDAALEEASAQLQRLYRELKRVTAESGLMEKKLRAAEEDASTLRQRALDAEAEREKRMQQVEHDFLDREKRLLTKLEEREAAMKAEREALHDRYMALTRDVEKSRESVLDQHSVLSEEASIREQRHREKLEEELKTLHSAQHRLETEKRTLEASLAAAAAKAHALESEKMLLTQHAEATIQDAEAARAVLERRLTETTEARGHTTRAAEDALREQAARLTALETEKTQLHRQLADLEARVQHDTAAHKDAQQRDAADLAALRTRCEETQEMLTAATAQHQTAMRKLESELKTRTAALDRAEAALRDAEEKLDEQARKLTAAEDEAARQVGEIDRLSDDVRRWKDAEARATAKARQATLEYEARILELERAVHDAKDAADLQRGRSQDLQTRQQNEMARLTRELHASEAARRALEDQFHLSQDANAQATLLQGLRAEKETLQARVLELERTNGEIQAQITNFTLELQNDPLVRNARETQQRLLATQQELLHSKEETETLRGVVKAKEEEAARYQMALMREEFRLDLSADDDLGASHSRRHVPSSTRLLRHRQQQEQQEAFDKLKDTCASLRKALRKEKRRRRRYEHRARAEDKSAVADAARVRGDRELADRDARSDAQSSTSTSISTSRSSSADHQVSRDRTSCTARASRARERTLTRGTSSRGASSPALARGKEDQEVRLQEAEVWRRKCLQLEQHLRLLLRERDELQATVRRADKALQTAEEEKRTLIDINAHLKSQLRDAYRTAFETQGHRSQGAGSISATTNASATAAATSHERVSPEVYAAVLSLLEREQRQRLASQSVDGAPSTSAVDTVAAHFDKTNESRGGVPLAPTPQGLNHSPARVPETIVDGQGRIDTHDADRLSRLEEDIRHVKARISATQKRHETSTSESGTSRRERDAAPSTGDTAPVLRRGGAAVRHYGYA